MSYRVPKPTLLASVLALSVIAAGCDSGPTRPGPVPTPTPPVGVIHSVSGAVTEMTEGGPVPVEGVRVEESSTHQSAMTNANGFYSMSGIQATNSSLLASKVGYVTVTTPLIATADTRLDIRVTRVVTYTLSGAVTEMTEGGPVPVEGVRVEESSTHQSAMTNENGFYSMSGIQATNSSLVASKVGYVTVTTPLIATADTRVDIRIMRIVTYTLSGMAYELTPAGRVPIEGVVLYCDGCGSPEGHTAVTTDADGLYSFSWVFRGITYLQVIGKEGYQYVGPASTVLGVPVTTVGDTSFDVEFVRR